MANQSLIASQNGNSLAHRVTTAMGPLGIRGSHTSICHQCSRQILLEKRVPLSKLVSLDEISLDVRPHELDQLHGELLKSAVPEAAERASGVGADAFAACVALLAIRGDLALYVADKSRAFRLPDLPSRRCRGLPLLVRLGGSGETPLHHQAVANAPRLARNQPRWPTDICSDRRSDEILSAATDFQSEVEGDFGGGLRSSGGRRRRTHQ